MYQFVGLDMLGMVEEPLRATREAQSMLAEACRAFVEQELIKGGRKDEQSQ